MLQRSKNVVVSTEIVRGKATEISEKPSILRHAAREMGASLRFGTESSAALRPMMALPRSHEGCGASDRARAGSFTGTPMGGEFDVSGQTLFFASLP